MSRSVFARLFIVIGTIFFLLGSARAQTSYSITQITGPAGVTNIRPYDINSSGVVVGSCRISGGARAFVWDAVNGMTLLPDHPSISEAYAARINDVGTIVGRLGNSTGALWVGGSLVTAMSNTMDGHAVAVLSNDQVLGHRTYSSVLRPVLYTPGTNTHVNLNSAIGVTSSVLDMNDFGQVLKPYTVYQYSAGGSFNLPQVGGYNVDAIRISPLGAVTGSCYNTNGVGTRAFIWRPFNPNGSTGRMTVIPTLGGNSANGYDLNVWNDVVGWSYDGSGNACAFAYFDGQTHNLTSMISNSSSWVLSQAYAINNAGQIVGSGLISGTNAAYFLTPDN